MQKNDLTRLRKDFPVFQQKVNGYPFIYFDSAATAQMPQQVMDAMTRYYMNYKSNVGRGIYSFAEKATMEYELARKKVAQFINTDNQDIIFTSGATDGINIIARSWVQHNLKEGDEVIISDVEHHSNFLPWQQLAEKKNLTLTIVPVNENGVVEVEALQKIISIKTKFVSLIHTSNILGTTNDITSLVKIVHSVGAKILVDASQSVVHEKIDVQRLGCDFLVFSGHKLFGPTGIGVLYIKKTAIKEMELPSVGGGMVYHVGLDRSEFKGVPYCFESGTPQIAQAIGLGTAIDYLNENIDFDLLQQHETNLTKQMLDGLSNMKDIHILSSLLVGNEKSNLITFWSDQFHAHDIAAYLDQYGVAVRAGNHCVQPYHTCKNINASVRISFSVYNTEDEVAFVLDLLKKLLD